MDAEARIKAQVQELQCWLSFEELKELGVKSDRLFADALALAKARSTPMLVRVLASPAAGVDDVATAEPAELSTAPTVADELDSARAETSSRDTQ